MPHLAQLNIATMQDPQPSAMADFMANLDRINALAEAAPGFVWRMVGDPPVNPFGEHTLVNLSVWQDFASLSQFVYRSAHADILRRRREWFLRQEEATTVLWWVPERHTPTVAEAADRLARLRAQGPGVDAFTFSRRFASGEPQDE